MFTTVSELDTDSDEFLSDEELDVNDHSHSATARRPARSRPHAVDMGSLTLSKIVISFEKWCRCFRRLAQAETLFTQINELNSVAVKVLIMDWVSLLS